MKKNVKRIFLSLLLSSALCIAAAGNCLAYDPGKAVYQIHDGGASASKLVYEYKPDSQYVFETKVGNVTDIELHPGEEVTYIVGGETERWMVDKAVVGATTHVYIKPLASDITTNIIINTNQRSYRLIVSSGDKFTPIVGWEYPDEARALFARKVDEFLERDLTHNVKTSLPERINKNYKLRNVKNVDLDILPLAVWDDGTRTYIRMPRANKYDMPTLYNINPEKKPELVNYRVKGNLYIADRVFRRARLQYSPKKYIEILPKYEPVMEKEKTDEDVPSMAFKTSPTPPPEMPLTRAQKEVKKAKAVSREIDEKPDDVVAAEGRSFSERIKALRNQPSSVQQQPATTKKVVKINPEQFRLLVSKFKNASGNVKVVKK